MRVAQVCSVHSADDGRVFHRTSVALAQAGYDVHLVAVGEGRERYAREGVTVHPLPQVRSRLDRFTRCGKVADVADALNPALYHVHEPDVLGPVLKRARGKPVIYDVHESYLDVLSHRAWIPSAARPALRAGWDWWERHLVRRCAGIIVVTEPIARRYRELHRRVTIVANFSDLSPLADLPAVERDGRSCVFAGGISPERGLSYVVEALAVLRGRGLELPLKLAGPETVPGYLDQLQQHAERLGVAHLLSYHGRLTKEAAIAFQNSASIGLATYLPTPNNMAGMPTKLPECMALGLPVVFSHFPVYLEVAGEAGAGIAVDPTSPREIAEALQRLVCQPALARQMGEAGRQAAQKYFNWAVEREKLLGLYRELLGPTG
jgi:glycosyltransferase involved in cell wall biosynthesis